MSQEIVVADPMGELARLGVPLWTRRDGTQVYLPEMQDKHLEFALAILKPWRRDCLARGETGMAITLRETIDMLKLEQRRRKRIKKRL